MKKPREAPRFERQEFLSVVKNLRECGWITDLKAVDDSCFLAMNTVSARDTARAASEFTNGHWHVHRNSLRWANGKQHFYLMTHGDIRDLQRVRKITLENTGKTPGYSFGSCAAAWLKWALEPTPSRDTDKALLAGGHLNYHESIPGQHPGAVYYDMAGCYYQQLRRMKSPRVYLDEAGDIHFMPLRSNERAKWTDALTLFENEKPLRNSVWGCMLGTSDDKWCWRHGKEVKAFRFEGHSYGAAALIARSAWELCRAAATEVRCIYSQTDGVFSTEGHPHYWDVVGMEHVIKQHGAVDIKFQHSYKFEHGDPTGYYEANQTYSKPVPRPAAVAREYHLEWLA